jgi:hypothetical protein
MEVTPLPKFCQYFVPIFESLLPEHNPQSFCKPGRQAPSGVNIIKLIFFVAVSGTK